MIPTDLFPLCIHPSAGIDRTAIIGKPPLRARSLARQPSAQPVTSIGADTLVDAYAIVYRGVQIGSGCLIGAGAKVRENCVIGSRVTIGTNADISHDVILSDNVRIQSGCHITGGTIIGEGTFLAPGVLTASDNDLDGLRAFQWDERHHAPPIIGKHVVVGVGAVILPGVRIGDGATIAAGAVVTKSVPAGETWAGVPARCRTSNVMVPIARFDPECDLSHLGHPA